MTKAKCVLTILFIKTLHLSLLTAEDLPIPPLLDYTRQRGQKIFELDAKEAQHRFSSKHKAQTLGYNGDYLGPTIKVQAGDAVSFKVKNSMSEPTTVHWHGLHVPAEMDGNMFQPIRAGGQWQANYTIKQEAGSFWYHPHKMGKTAKQVYQGLAGMYIIEDKNSMSLGLPSQYGVDDIPLVLQDKAFNRSGNNLTYDGSIQTAMMYGGMSGNTFIVNGVLQPTFKVQGKLTRFRVLNASNSSLYQIYLSDKSSFQIIAGDASLLDKPVRTNTILLSPGERTEIVIDFSRFKKNDKLQLRATLKDGREITFMSFDRNNYKDMGSKVPRKLNTASNVNKLKIDKQRRLKMGHHLRINGSTFDPGKINIKIKEGDTEEWIVQGSNMVMRGGFSFHNLHIHDVTFQIKSINGKRPKPELSGFKDTVFIPPRSEVRLIAKFKDYKGKYVYHCHLLEHEDLGMMGIFEVG
ncbi:multicopper oxidase domain-containing protein [Candidatus Haliotispira prima]|uniref:Multicopper oxidase domain-containing protein n=1 Tax=Candidatus Haliotispira prima TaxID=3034016 RepID=A0ABY8MEJ5_9SPIO|nr:multicopper oxidase domain-containing protein [Candidatus Haliotispira prima]